MHGSFRARTKQHNGGLRPRRPYTSELRKPRKGMSKACMTPVQTLVLPVPPSTERFSRPKKWVTRKMMRIWVTLLLMCTKSFL